MMHLNHLVTPPRQVFVGVLIMEHAIQVAIAVAKSIIALYALGIWNRVMVRVILRVDATMSRARWVPVVIVIAGIFRI